MAGSKAALSQDEVGNLRTAMSSLALFEEAGVLLKFWEAYWFASSDPALFGRERRRLTESKPEVSPEFLERLRVLRNDLGSLIGRLRRMVSAAAVKPQDSDRQEMILGLIATSSSGRAAATRWVYEPSRFEREAFEKIRLLEAVVEAQQTALRAELLGPEKPQDPPAPLPSSALEERLVVAQPVTPPTSSDIPREGLPDGGSAPKVAERVDFSAPKNIRRSARPPGPLIEVSSTPTVARLGKADAAVPPAPPLPPLNLSAEAQKEEIFLKWEAGDSANTYNLKRASVSGGPYATIASSLSQASFVDMDIAPGTSYFYVVSSRNGAGEGPNSSEISQTAPPPAPADLVARAGENEVALSWTGVPGALTYAVKRGRNPGGLYTTIARDLIQTGFVDTSIKSRTTFYYVVAAINAGGEGLHSKEAEATPMPPPEAPENLEARSGNAQVILSWTPSLRASAYNILRSLTSGVGYERIAASVATTIYTDGEARNGRTYFYVVTAAHEGGESSPSGEARATPLGPPAPPASLVAKAANAQVLLSWKASQGAESYRVARSLTAEGPFATIAKSETTSYLDKEVLNGTTYHYAVIAVNAGGESADSPRAFATLVAPPRAPANLVAAPGKGIVALSWTALAEATGYSVFRSVTPGAGFERIAKAIASPSYTDKAVENGTTYFYAVSAIREGDESSPSAEARATPLGPPTAPADLVAKEGNAQVSLSWTASPGAAAYAVKRALAAEAPFATIGKSETTSYLDKDLRNGATYYYAVIALNAGGESADSPRISATPIDPPAAPADFFATPGNGEVVLSWSPSGGAHCYRIKRSLDRQGPYQEVKTSADCRYVDGSVANGTSYFYVVTASNAGGESAETSLASATPLAPPAAPAKLEARPGNAQVLLSWVASPRATGYSVFRSLAPDTGHERIAQAIASTSYIDTGAMNGTTYSYAVTATHEGGESPLSADARATPLAPPAPPNDLATKAANAQVLLSWTASPGAESYRVIRSLTAEGSFATIGRSETTSYLDKEVQNGATYHYAVVAINAGGESVESARAMVRPLGPPAVPAKLEARAGNSQVVLSWTGSPQAIKYNVLRSLQAGTGFERIAAGILATSYSDLNVKNGTAYSYIVTAVHEGGESSPSAEARATPLGPPETPSDLVAKAGNARVSLSWAATPGAASYRIKRSPSPEGPFAMIGALKSTAYVDKEVQNGVTYHYSVSAVNPAAESEDSSRASATPMAPPLAPAKLVAVTGNGEVVLSWSPSEGARSYRIRRSLLRRGPYKEVATSVECRHVDGPLINGKTYFYVVSSLNAGGESADSLRASATPIAPPEAPARFFAAPGNSRVSLSWAASRQATKYNVLRSLQAGAGYERIASGISSTTFVDTDVKNGTPYYYVVTAVHDRGESSLSAEARTTPLAPPAPPSDLAAKAANAQVLLSWTASPGAASYRVKRSPIPEGPFASIGTTETTSYVDQNLLNGAPYHYCVTAVNAGGESADTSRASAIPAAPPAAPGTFTATSGSGEVILLWSPSEGARRYRIKRSLQPRGPYKEIGTSVECRYVDGSVTNGTTYFYIVSASNAAGTGPFSARAQAMPVAPPEPLPPLPSPPSVAPPLVAAPAALSEPLPPAPAPAGPETAAERKGLAGDPTESVERIPLPLAGKSASPGLDLEKLLDLRRVGELRAIFKSTAQRIEVWEVLWIVAHGGYEARRTIERLVRLKQSGDSPELEEQAAEFFGQILKARTQAGAKVEEIQRFFQGLNVEDRGGETMAIAIGLIVTSAKGRKRAEEWLGSPDSHRDAASVYLTHALDLAKKYDRALESP